MKKKGLIAVIAVFAVLVTAIIGVALTGRDQTENKMSTDNGKETSVSDSMDFFPYTLSNGCEILEIKGVSGTFPEDGTDMEKENVAALVIRNGTDQHFQLMNLVVETDQGKFEFQLTTFFADSIMTVFEKNACPFREKMKIQSVRLTRSVEFAPPPTVYPEVFEITVHDSVLNIKNISGSDIDSDIYIYYKSVDDNSDWYGGITYRTGVQGGLKNNELRQLPASHFRSGKSKVVFVTYADESL